MAVPIPVEGFTQQFDKTRRDSAELAEGDAFLLLELAEDRAVDERLARVDAHAPKARAQGVRNAQRGVHDVVLKVDEARDVHVSFRRALRGEVSDRVGSA